ncbi:hypothetical protein [uncultured Maribacter sp.]|uniref:hypothetical protein n=1 Tax=uncultured Maribacter sp. TaxID=431308 RepID=UPI0030DC883C
MGQYFNNSDTPLRNSYVKRLKAQVSNSEGLWYVCQQLIKVKSIVVLPEKDIPLPIVSILGIDNLLENKLSSRNLHHRALAIQYSYELEITANYKKIHEFINSSNIFVRREAQLAMVVFMNWEILSFFAKLTYPISLWQQIRIIEKLKSSKKPIVTESLKSLLNSKNTDILELGMRLVVAFNVEREFNMIKSHTQHHNTKLANAAFDMLVQLNISKPYNKEQSFSKQTFELPFSYVDYRNHKKNDKL